MSPKNKVVFVDFDEFVEDKINEVIYSEYQIGWTVKQLVYISGERNCLSSVMILFERND